MWKKTFISSCFLWFAFICADGQEIKLTGRITDSEDHLPLPAVNVQVILRGDTLKRYTNLQGVFSFSLPAQKNGWLIANYVGYKSFRVALDKLPADTLRIKMKPASETLKEIVITGKRQTLLGTSEAGSIHINPGKLSQVPSIMGVPDIIKVLQLMPGVQNSGESNGYLYVRGADPGHNLMLYDDAPVYGMSHLLGIFPFYNPDHIDRIYFNKSNTNASYGNRLSATLQATSPDEIPGRFSVKGNVGILASQLSLEIPLGNKSAIYVSGRQTYVDQIVAPIINDERVVKEDGTLEKLTYSFTDANFTFLTKPNTKHTFSLSAFFSKDRFGLKENKMLLDADMDWGNYTVSGAWKWKINDNIRLKHSIYFTQYNNDIKAAQAAIEIKTNSRITDWGAKNMLEFELFNIPFEAGLQLSKYNVRPQEISSNQLSDDYIKNMDRTETAWQSAAFIQARPQLTPSIYADLGMRFNYYRNTEAGSRKYFHPEPHISLHYTPTPKLKHYIAYSRRNQYLNLVMTSSVGFPTDFWVTSSKDIPAQSANNFSIGSTYKPAPGFELSASLFYSQLSNLIEYPYTVLNFNELTTLGDDIQVGKGRSYGLELMLQKNGRLSGWVSYTLSRSDRKFREINDYETLPAKFDRRHNLSIVASYELSSRWNIGATQVYTSGSRFTTPTSWYFINNSPVKEYDKLNNAQMPDYIRTDISVDYFFVKTAKRESALNLSVYNMFAVNNPIYIILDVSADEKAKEVGTITRFKKLYSILPSIGWRFKF